MATRSRSRHSHNPHHHRSTRQTATISSSNQTHTTHITVGTGHNVLLNNPLALVAATQASLAIQSPQQVTTPLLSRQNDSFSEATNKLRTKLTTSHGLITHNNTTNHPRPTYPVLPPPPNTRPARSTPAFRHPSSIPYRKPVPKLFRDPNTMSTPSPAVAPSPNLVTPANQNQALPSTPSMALGEADLFAGLSLDPAIFKGARQRSLPLVLAPLFSSDSFLDPSKDDPNNFLFNLDTDRKCPHRSSSPPRLSKRVVNFAAAMFANPMPQTPQAQYTPAVVPNSPAIDLMSGIVGPTVRQMQMSTPLFGSEGAQLGLMGIDTGFGFTQAQDPFGSDMMTDHGFQDLQEILEQLNSGPITVSPRDLQAPPSSTFTTFTSSPFTPVVAKHTPLLTTPASASVPLSATAAHSASITDSGQKRSSPLSDAKSRLKRGRSEEDGEQSATKRRKHTGTRPGITSTQLLPPGAPPQHKTYVTESSTSRKDIPASYKHKSGDLPDDSAMNKIVAKRTANRDSARRSRMRKQAAMEHAMHKVTIMAKRVEQLEDFIRAFGQEPPAPLECLDSPIMENDEDGD